MQLPSGATEIINRLSGFGIDAYLVGGCVRDALMGKTPKDYDVAAGASPEKICNALKDFRIIETGIKHGTVTVLAAGESYEVTAFRTDGAYSDGRHPDTVSFCTNIKDDLARRDFTINAMAYSPTSGLIDPFGGEVDLKAGMLRAVGDACQRFTEDALRILRLLRFASRFGFEIDNKTLSAALSLKSRLKLVSPERIFAELKGILSGSFAGEVLRKFSAVVFEIIPELKATFDFPQQTIYHKYDVWRHITETVAAADSDICVRLSMLLHDAAKPECFFMKDGQAHFHGHPAKSADIAMSVLNRLHCDSDTRDRVVKLIFYHDIKIKPDKPEVKKWLNKLGADDFFLLMKCQLADASGKADHYRSEQTAQVEELKKIAVQILENGECFGLSHLQINGNDLISLGLESGKIVGDILDILLDEVISGQLQNDYDSLETRACELIATAGCGIENRNV